MYIVSRNYMDLRSKDRWLVRKGNQKPEQARAFSSVKAVGVHFEQSSALESGFGCYIVAKTKIAKGSRSTDNKIHRDEVKLRFMVNHFETMSGQEVKTCASLRLTPNRSVYAVLKTAKPKNRKRQSQAA